MNKSLFTKTFVVAAIAALTAFSNAQQTVTVSFEGADVVRTSNNAPEKVQVGYSGTLHWQGGMATIADSADMGFKFESGGPDMATVPGWDLFEVTMNPGDTVEAVLALYVSKSGSLLDNLLNNLIQAGSTDRPTAFPALRQAMAAGGFSASSTVSDLMSSGSGFLGSVRVYLWCDENGEIGWNLTPMANALDLGWTGQSELLMFQSGRAQYLPQIAVKG